MRIDVRLAAVAAGIVLAAVMAAPVHAQSLLQSLFGQSTAKPVEALPPPMPSYRAPVNVQRSRPLREDADEEVPSAPRLAGAKVRTVCVRMCDGFYFPISSQTRQSRLTSDSLRCKAACGHEARLFYSTDAGDDPASMVDLTGRRYDAIQNAFAYRKKLTPGCACKPVPWSAEERMRHTRYAIERAEAIAKAREAEAVKLAAAQGRAAGQGAPHAANEEGTRPSHQSVSGDSAPATPGEVAEMHPASSASSETAMPRVIGERTWIDQPAERSERQARTDRPTKRTLARGEPNAATARSRTNAVRPARQATASPASGSLFNFGTSKYVWPGDPR